MSMLRSLDHGGELGSHDRDVIVIHSARTRDQVIFLPVLRISISRHERVRLDLRLTSERGRLSRQVTWTRSVRTGGNARRSVRAREKCSTR